MPTSHGRCAAAKHLERLLVLLQVGRDARDAALAVAAAAGRSAAAGRTSSARPARAAGARSRFIRPIASRSLLVGDRRRRNALRETSRNFCSSRTQCSSASGSSAFCGSSSTYIGRDSAISSYIFFLPSQVVSPTTRSAISRNGLLPQNVVAVGRLDQRAEIGRQVLLGRRESSWPSRRTGRPARRRPP